MKRYCDRCGSDNVHKHSTKVSLARGKSQRYQCQKCARIFHDPLSMLPQEENIAFFDIETSQAGRGAGNFGIIYSYCLLEHKTDKIYGTCMRTRSIKEEKRVVKQMCKDLRRFDRVLGWYSTHHDIPVSRSRAEFHGLDFPGYSEVYNTPQTHPCLLYTSPSPRDGLLSRMPSSA